MLVQERIHYVGVPVIGKSNLNFQRYSLEKNDLFRYWTGDQCSNTKSFNQTCTTDSECDFNNFLTCISGRCNCNSTQFWNNGNY